MGGHGAAEGAAALSDQLSSEGNEQIGGHARVAGSAMPRPLRLNPQSRQNVGEVDIVRGEAKSAQQLEGVEAGRLPPVAAVASCLAGKHRQVEAHVVADDDAPRQSRQDLVERVGDRRRCVGRGRRR